MSTETVTIASLSHKRQRRGPWPDGPSSSPFTLPAKRGHCAGEERGNRDVVWRHSPDRVTPPCRHFGPEGLGGTCGGCSLQHQAKPAYNAYKRDILVQALKAKGLDAPVAEIFEAHPHQRRRLVFTVRKRESAL